MFFRRPDSIQRLRLLLKYAIMAPSFRNTQPWKFRVTQDEIWVYADTQRWLKVADADKREMYISIGACMENLVVAAEYYNYQYKINYFPDPFQPELVAIIKLHLNGDQKRLRDSTMLEAMINRSTYEKAFSNKPITAEHWMLLESCYTDEMLGVTSVERSALKQKVTELTSIANQVLFTDKSFRRELSHCIASGHVGHKPVLRQLASIKMRYHNPAAAQMKKHTVLWDKSAACIILCSRSNAKLDHVMAGQVYERIALIAHSAGIGLHPMNQVLQIPELKGEIKQMIRGSHTLPQQIFRLGYMRKSAPTKNRRPLEDVLI